MSEITKKVIIELKPITVEVKVDSKLSNSEVLEIAMKSIQPNTIKCSSYGVYAAETLSFENVKLGMIVKDNKGGSLGIVIKINKKTIDVSLTGRRVVSGSPLAFSKVEDKLDIDSIMWKRIGIQKEEDSWYEGDVGYLISSNAIHHAVVTKHEYKVSTGSKYTLYMINTETGSHCKGLTDAHMKAFFFDVKEDAEKALKNFNK